MRRLPPRVRITHMPAEVAHHHRAGPDIEPGHIGERSTCLDIAALPAGCHEPAEDRYYEWLAARCKWLDHHYCIGPGSIGTGIAPTSIGPIQYSAHLGAIDKNIQR